MQKKSLCLLDSAMPPFYKIHQGKKKNPYKQFNTLNKIQGHLHLGVCFVLKYFNFANNWENVHSVTENTRMLQ